jgi:hypothetical protein
MDKHLAYVIANGKNHHTALRAKEKFHNSVDVADYVQKDEINVDNEPDVFDQNQEEPLSIDTRDDNQSESDSNDDDSGDQE